MKAKVILIIILMTVIPILSLAQTQSGDDSASTNPPAAADSLLPDPGPTAVPAGPGSLGPQDSLQYQTVMVTITQNCTANLAGITEAVQEGKMSSEEGKTSAAEQYLIAKMQFQLLGAWRQMDKQDQVKAPAPDDKSDASPTDD